MFPKDKLIYLVGQVTMYFWHQCVQMNVMDLIILKEFPNYIPLLASQFLPLTAPWQSLSLPPELFSSLCSLLLPCGFAVSPTKGAECISQTYDLVFSHVTCLGQKNKVQVKGCKFCTQVLRRLGCFHLLSCDSTISMRTWLRQALWSEKESERHIDQPTSSMPTNM